MDRRGIFINMGVVLITGALFVGLYRLYLSGSSAGGQTTLHVLSYSSFLNSWGPGREIALAFERETGIAVEYRDAGDAGLLLRKLELFPSDVVIGLDQLTIPDARKTNRWRALPEGGARHQPEFLAFDYSPMTFVYREDGPKPPETLDDLLDPRFSNSLSLQDPRTSTPGMQFLFWVLDVKGVNEGFVYLAKLKANVKAVSPNWSAAYGLFTQNQAKLVFSYFTSPLYHFVNEEDARYHGVRFKEGLPLQIEYVGVPATCTECEAAEKFARYLLRPETQKLIMTKNYMLPIRSEVMKGTPFEKLHEEAGPVKEHEWKKLPELLDRREEIFERWRWLGLG